MSAIDTTINIIKFVQPMALGISFLIRNAKDREAQVQVRNFTSDHIALKITKTNNLEIEYPKCIFETKNWDSTNFCNMNSKNSWLSIPTYDSKGEFAKINFKINADSKRASLVLQDIKSAKKIGIYFKQSCCDKKVWKYKIHKYRFRYKEVNQ